MLALLLSYISINLFLVSLPWSCSFFWNPTLLVRLYLTFPSWTPCVDLVFPCHSWGSCSPYSPGALWGSLPSVLTVLHMESPHFASFLILWTFLNTSFCNTSSRVLLYSDSAVHPGPEIVPDLPSILSKRESLDELTGWTRNSCQMTFIP